MLLIRLSSAVIWKIVCANLNYQNCPSPKACAIVDLWNLAHVLVFTNFTRKFSIIS